MTLLTMAEAATLVGVPVTTVQSWRTRGTLRPFARDPRGRLLFRPADVLEAERVTRRNDPTRRRARRVAEEASRA